MADLGPGEIFLEEKSILVLGNSKVITNGPLIKSLRNLQNWSLKFQKWQKLSLGFKNWIFTFITIVLFNNEKKSGPYNFWKFTVYTPKNPKSA